MRRLLYIVGILLTLIIGAILQYHYCCNCEDSCPADEKNVVEEMPLPPPTPKAFALKGFTFSTDQFSVSHPENYLFTEDSYEFHQPLGENFISAINAAKAHFDAHPAKIMNIVGHYATSETNNSVFPTLGLARANAVKNHLVSLGYPAKQLVVSDALIEELPQGEGFKHELIAYSVADINPEEDKSKLAELEAFATDIKKNPIRLYFQTGESQINLSAEERTKIQQLNNYVAHFEEACILVIGNTDNVGKRVANLKLGQERADFVKDYLVKNNFDTKYIEAISYGPDKPIESNKTDEGRSLNRRVEITLK
ncbi:MAG: OmpA family protein [Capnocytophaga sp.]|nr:OmpA family protein [Capnocytophaga sp.]